MVTLKINGKTVTAAKGATVLEAATEAGIQIPTLCKHEKLTPFAGCRMCLVEVAGTSRLYTSCTTPVWNGMDVTTQTPHLEEIRKTIVELMLSDHPNDCMVCESAGDCALQDMAYHYGVRENRFEGERRAYEKRDGNPFIEREMEKCIMCGNCVKVCDEVQGVGAIDFAYRGFNAKVSTAYERDLDCEFCGQCVAVCPTGALTGRMWAHKGRQMGVREVHTVCPYCGTGCNITLNVRDNEVIRVTSPPGSWNEGWLCVKGRFGYGFINSPERLTMPLIKKRGKFKEASWEEALDFASRKLSQIRKKHGADSIGGLASARCTNEENYLFQKFIRAAVGTNNVDHCARL
jgi:predicted molibdopterin-dependent oxidoreductase YjgC